VTRFVVERCNCCWNDNFLYRLPGANPVSSHATREQAEQECRHLEEKARRNVNPFRFGGQALFYQTHLDEGRWCDWVLDASLEPPKDRSCAGWAKWWQRQHKKWTPLQWAHLWEGLSRIWFYRVGERPRRPVLYALARINWCWIDLDEYFPELEGGRTEEGFNVYRSRARAEKDGEEFDEDYRDLMAEGRYFIDLRTHQQRTPFTPVNWGKLTSVPLEEAPLHEVFEVEVEGADDPSLAGLPRCTPLYLLQRQSWRANNGHFFDREEEDGGVPLLLFMDRLAAEDRCADLEHAARAEVCPVLYGGGYVDEQCGMSPAQLKERLAALGVPPPPADALDTVLGELPWQRWWTEVVGGLSDEQRDGVWDLLKPGPFYEVIEQQLWD
jgi:hypothetical protein